MKVERGNLHRIFQFRHRFVISWTARWSNSLSLDESLSYFGEPPRYPSIEQFSPWFSVTGPQNATDSVTLKALSTTRNCLCIYAFGPVTFHLCTPNWIFLPPMVPCQIRGGSDILMLLCCFSFPFGCFGDFYPPVAKAGVQQQNHKFVTHLDGSSSWPIIRLPRDQ